MLLVCSYISSSTSPLSHIYKFAKVNRIPLALVKNFKLNH